MERKRDAISKWYVPWEEFREVIAGIQRADGEAEGKDLRRVQEAAQEAKRDEEWD